MEITEPNPSAGIPALNNVLEKIIPGDNVVWKIDSIDEYILVASQPPRETDQNRSEDRKAPRICHVSDGGSYYRQEVVTKITSGFGYISTVSILPASIKSIRVY